MFVYSGASKKPNTRNRQAIINHKDTALYIFTFYSRIFVILLYTSQNKKLKRSSKYQ